MAYALASRIERAVKKSGLEVVWVSGWKSRGRATMGTIQTITLHHTATPRSFKKGTEYPTYNVVKDGRPGLPGPLAQLGLGRTGTVYVFAAGRANHAGVSRSTSMTNSHAIGIEAEGAMEAWPAAQYQAYLRLVRALVDEFNLGTSRALRHGETCSPPGRKTDASFSGLGFRKSLGSVNLGAAKPTPTPAPSKKEGPFGMTVRNVGRRDKDIALAAGKYKTIPINDKGDVSIISGLTKGDGIMAQVVLALEGVPKGSEIVGRFYYADYKKGEKTKRHYTFPAQELIASSGGSFGALTLIDSCGSSPAKGWSRRLRFELRVFNAGAKVTRAEFKSAK